MGVWVEAVLALATSKDGPLLLSTVWMYRQKSCPYAVYFKESAKQDFIGDKQ